MVGKGAERREDRNREIIDIAWRLAAVEGIGGFSLHGGARELGIRPPSPYEYFDSNVALYQAMFADGNRKLLGRITGLTLPDDPRRAVKAFMRAFVEFALEDPARMELMFSRPIPGFEPSEQSYKPAVTVLERAR